MTHERGSRPVIRRCRLNVRFARKRTWLGYLFMSTGHWGGVLIQFGLDPI